MPAVAPLFYLLAQQMRARQRPHEVNVRKLDARLHKLYALCTRVAAITRRTLACTVARFAPIDAHRDGLEGRMWHIGRARRRAPAIAAASLVMGDRLAA